MEPSEKDDRSTATQKRLRFLQQLRESTAKTPGKSHNGLKLVNRVVSAPRNPTATRIRPAATGSTSDSVAAARVRAARCAVLGVLSNRSAHLERLATFDRIRLDFLLLLEERATSTAPDPPERPTSPDVNWFAVQGAAQAPTHVLHARDEAAARVRIQHRQRRWIRAAREGAAAASAALVVRQVVTATALPGLAANLRLDVLGDPLPQGASSRIGSQRFRHPHANEFVRESPRNDCVLSAGQDSLRIFDIESGLAVMVVHLRHPVVDAIWRPDGSAIAFTCRGDECGPFQWDLDRGFLTRYQGADRAEALTYSPNGQLLAAGVGDTRVTVWSSDDGFKVRSIVMDRTLSGHEVTGLSFSPDARTLAATCNVWREDGGRTLSDVLLVCWRSDNWTLAGRFWSHDERWDGLRFDSSGHSVGGPGAGTSINLVDGSLGRGLPADTTASLADRRRSISERVGLDLDRIPKDGLGRVSLSPGGSLLASDAALFDVDHQLAVDLSQPIGACIGHAFSENGQDVWRLLKNGTLLSFSSFTQDEQKRPRTLATGYTLSTSSGEGGIAAIAGSRTDPIRLYKLPDWREVGRLGELEKGGVAARATSIQISVGGQWLVCGDEAGTLTLWVLTLRGTGQLARKIELTPGVPVAAVAVSRDGSLVAAATHGGQNVYVCERESNFEPQRLPNADDDRHSLANHPCQADLVGLGFSHDGRQLACGGDDWSVRIWDVESRRPTRRLEGHLGNVQACIFHPTSDRLITSSADGTVLTWRA